MATAAVCGLALAACGDDDIASDDTVETTVPVAAATAGDTSAAEAAGDDTVVVEHRFGETDIDGIPQRIVSLNLQWTDVLLAMGVEPVGVLGDTVVSDGAGRYAWQHDHLEADVMLDSTSGIPFEAVAALEPDLIVGTFVIEEQRQYDLLSDIAPTIALLQSSGAMVDPWQELASVAGQVLRDEERSSELIAEVDQLVADTREALPGLEAKTFALSQYVVGDAIYVVADPDDGSSMFFHDLGMELPPSVVELSADGGPRPSLSPEQVDVLDADLLAFFINGGDESNLVELPGWDLLPSVRDGAVALLDYDAVVGLNTPTPLSIPYSLDAMMPALEAAAD